MRDGPAEGRVQVAQVPGGGRQARGARPFEPVEVDEAAWTVRPSEPSALLRFYEKMNLESLARPLRPAEPAPGQGMLDFGGE